MKYKHRDTGAEVEAEPFTNENKDRCFFFFDDVPKTAHRDSAGNPFMRIEKNETGLIVELGNWIVKRSFGKALRGEYSVMSSDDFNLNYERVQG
jgi:hypothetical protein